MDTSYFNWNYLYNSLPNLLLAVIILIVGWLIAKVIEAAVKKGLLKTKLDNRLAEHAGVDTKKYSTEAVISKFIFYIIFLFAIIAALNYLNLQVITSPLIDMLSSIFAAIPSILKAALLLLFAWAIASALRFLIRKSGRTLRINQLMEKWHITDQTNAAILFNTLGNIVFYFILLLAIPGVLDALDLNGVSGPFSAMLASILVFIPKLLTAALYLIIGWFIAKIIRDIVTKFFEAIGTDKLVHRFRLSSLFEGTTLSSVLGTVVFVFIMIPVVISALDKLDVQGISEPAIHMLNQILMMLPNIAVAILLVLVGIWLGKWVNQIVSSLLRRVGMDSILKNAGIGRSSTTMPAVSISQLIGYLAQIIVVVLFIAQAFHTLGLDFFVSFISGILTYIPYILAALIILGVGLYAGNLLQHVLMTTIAGPNKRFLSFLAKYSIITLSIFMALDQLGVASSIVNSAFILILGGLVLAFGLSFGLGGKEFAAKYLNKLDQRIEMTSIQKKHKNSTDLSEPNDFKE